jgi:hypothetical protein
VLQQPAALDRSLFPNYATYQEAVNEFGAPVPFRERRWLMRFAVGKTF